MELFTPKAIWGRELRHHRLAAGLTQTQLSDRINFAVGLISGVETGQVAATPPFAERCDEVLKTGGALLRLLDWRKADRFPSWFDWPTYESGAVTLRNFQLVLIPGLLQNEDYARALLSGDEEAVAARMERQTILTREHPPPPFLVCVLDECVLNYEVGGPEVMHDQLMYLADSISPRVSIQIVPSGVAHPGTLGSFVLATLANRSEVAYVQTGVRGMTTGAPEDVGILSESFESIRSRALPLDQSMDLIRRTAEKRWT